MQPRASCSRMIYELRTSESQSGCKINGREILNDFLNRRNIFYFSFKFFHFSSQKETKRKGQREKPRRKHVGRCEGRKFSVVVYICRKWLVGIASERFSYFTTKRAPSTEQCWSDRRNWSLNKWRVASPLCSAFKCRSNDDQGTCGICKSHCRCHVAVA